MEKPMRKSIISLLLLYGSSKSGFLGEASIDFADFAAVIEPLTVSLPLKFANSGAILHVLNDGKVASTIAAIGSPTKFNKISSGISMVASPSFLSLIVPSPMLAIQSANCFNCCNSSGDPQFCNLMFFVNRRTLQCFHRYDELIVAPTISCLVPFGTTGNI